MQACTGVVTMCYDYVLQVLKWNMRVSVEVVRSASLLHLQLILAWLAPRTGLLNLNHPDEMWTMNTHQLCYTSKTHVAIIWSPERIRKMRFHVVARKGGMRCSTLDVQYQYQPAYICDSVYEYFNNIAYKIQKTRTGKYCM